MVKVKEDVIPKCYEPRPASPLCPNGGGRWRVRSVESEGIITKHIEWAAPILLVPKADKSIRICGQYNVKLYDMDQCPLPNPRDVCYLTGGSVFSKLDLSQDYQQMLLDGKSRKNTYN